MWSWDYALEILPQLLQVLPITIGATLLGFAAACLLGLPLALARRSRYRALSVLANAWMEFIRSTPLLVQLFVLFYALPLYGISFSPFVTGVIGLGLHYSAYLSEVFRSGIEAVPAGQWEAAKALNFGRRHSWTNIILPQAIPPIIPVMGNYLITMFKETPVLSAITLVELLQTAKAIGSGSFRYLEAFTLVGLLFLLLSYPSSLLVSRLEKKLQIK
ncbi:ectoine/hydroxyectoine ABC transporter permease subunit EhuD [Paenibacillus melissococcoides]|uniref:Ectoine/hydroxyectoine ABC transporter permease subunit EhuD n=1 Tax=Paenibacillus melissococcoides TaxID=2912268 RepID=A0ABM9G7Q9_9BACL|nr:MULTISPECIES: ectoine/hydroxyectoine ABC transporter permease subunit EhuD [Paenibacillus]MEB9893910.1 ectoine/hydroxyectoine ABC transporter permease subunit EhuD [Bacillus cereus]CAH8247963.1 ectoine/hydroxyectoine ABC transporter permease subunit EhuD [Paenibacillus melissococcoides]CAH8719019.1 ectoine/hydroxyectoine ABC transporter permease subunit EhuD [Paenibacillus melissococcoides]CAH8720027.1 ectoine/hydroxyectoine ABC transporter permease subunit EhuD [Paenibacillus melissococcoid